MKAYHKHKGYLVDQANQAQHFNLIAEEPLSIRVQGNPYSVVMRTPGDEFAHVAGFCLAEGIVDSPDEFSMALCDEDTNVVTVTLSENRRKLISDILDRRGFISQTSCGICGKQLVKDLSGELKPMDPAKDGNLSLSIENARFYLESLSDHQPLRAETRAAHAAAIYDGNGMMLSIAEDVGRHNALDKAVGKLFLNHDLNKAAIVVLSSRISYELVQKSARARIPIILAVSRPTALAVDLASSLNMTVACLSKKSGLFVFCGEHRIDG